MNQEKAIRINADESDKLLGCLWKISRGKLSSLPSDPFHDGTKYYYIPTSQSLDCFKKSIANIISNGDEKSNVEASIFTKARVDFKCVYLPVLQCGRQMLALNTSSNHYIIKQYFYNGTMPISAWKDCEMKEMEEGCINLENIEILPIDLSPKEIEYLISYYHLDFNGHYDVVFCPIYISELANDKQRFHAAQLASHGNAEINHEYPMDEASFLESTMQLAFVLLPLVAFLYFFFTNYSFMGVITPLATDYYAIFTNFHNSMRLQAYDFFILFGILFDIIDGLLGTILWTLLGSLILSGLLLAPIMLGFILSRLIFIVYIILKKYCVINKFCTIAKVNKSDVDIIRPIKLISNILFATPMTMILPFVILSGFYIIVKYII